MNYTPTIGLEIHAELKTQSKMFCGSPNVSDASEPNANICPVCMGHPGTLPVINREAVRHIIKIGHAVGGTIADYTEFDRKNYFYPDIPKGYQISQYDYPLVRGGSINGVELTRIHLEEDTGKSVHDKGDTSLLDFNRAGVPLMELVTEPVIKSGEEAAAFARELQLILRTLGVGDANMEKGEMRVEANISVSASEELGTKVEVKNLNSFKTMEKAVAYEIERHIKLLKEGGTIEQVTLGWDDANQKTYTQREKEESHDYRYFPDPDLVPFKVSEIEDFKTEAILAEMPELPATKRKRLVDTYGIKDANAEFFVRSSALAELFEASCKKTGDSKTAQLAANYITSDLVGLAEEQGEAPEAVVERGNVTAENFASLIKMAGDGTLSSRGAKDLLAILYQEGGEAEKIAKERGLVQDSDAGSIEPIVDQVIKDNPEAVEQYRSGKENALQFLIGQGMKASKGSANPGVLKEIFVKKLQS